MDDDNELKKEANRKAAREGMRALRAERRSKGIPDRLPPTKTIGEQAVEKSTRSYMSDMMTTVRDELRDIATKMFSDWPKLTKEQTYNRKGEYTEMALTRVKEMASAGRTQATIAAYLGVSMKLFEKQINEQKGENPLRRAWEYGRATHEQVVADIVLMKGLGNGKDAGACIIFYAKAQFGWRDKPDVAPGSGPAINIVLPGSMPEVDYLKKLGLTAPEDSRVRPAFKLGQTDPLLIEGKAVDVTPVVAATTPELAVKLPVVPDR